MLFIWFGVRPGIFTIQPIGALPEGVTLIYHSRNPAVPFFASPDGLCLQIQGSVSLLCRATSIGVVTDIADRSIIKLPYIHWAYLASTGGREFGQASSYSSNRQTSTDCVRLSIRSHSQHIENRYNIIVGEVENTGSCEAKFVKIFLTAYDAKGAVVDTHDTFVSPSNITANETSGFKFFILRETGMQTYKLRLE